MAISIKPLMHCEPDQVQFYYQTLYMEDTLKFRFSDLNEPTWADVIDIIVRCGKHMYLVFEDGMVVGDFFLEGFMGRSAQVHFGTNPRIGYKDSLRHVKDTLREVLTQWKHEDGGPYLESLYGFLPSKNRVACQFVLKCGFKKQCMVPKGIQYFGEMVDSMMVLLVRGDL